MMRNRKVWGVLGLLLALAVVVGYGQQPLGQQQRVAVLTVNKDCASAFNSKFELFTRENDVHPVRNITYQNKPSDAGFANPGGNPAGCPGVAYFASGMGGTPSPLSTVHIQIGSGAPIGTYTFKLCFRKSPGDAPNPVVTIDGELVTTITTTPGCQCGFDKSITIDRRQQPTSVGWNFTVATISVEFCRVEVWK